MEKWVYLQQYLPLTFFAIYHEFMIMGERRKQNIGKFIAFQKQALTPPKINSWNLKMMVWSRLFSLSRGVFSGSVLIFWDVCLWKLGESHLDFTEFPRSKRNDQHLQMFVDMKYMAC